MIPTPSIIPHIFRYLKFSQTQKGSSTKLFGTLYCDTKKIWRKIVILPPPRSSIKIFDTRIFLKPGRVFLRNFLVLWDQTISTTTHDTHPLYYPSHFSIPEISETLKGSPAKVFGTLKQKNSTEDRDTPPPFMHENFQYYNFSQTRERSPTKFFGTVRQIIIDRKSWYTPLMHKIFRHPKFSGTPKGSPTNFLVLWDKK